MNARSTATASGWTGILQCPDGEAPPGGFPVLVVCSGYQGLKPRHDESTRLSPWERVPLEPVPAAMSIVGCMPNTSV